MGTTTIPITPERLVEFLSGPGYGTIRTISVEEIGRDVYLAPSPTPADAAGAIMLQMALEGKTGEEIRAWLHESDEAQAYRRQRIIDAIKPPVPPTPPAQGTEAGRIVIERPTMRDDTGACWQWRGFTDFSLFYRWLTDDQMGSLDALVAERIGLGANVLRVLGMVDSFCHLWPQEHDDYYTQLRPFVDWLAGHQMRVEFVVFADAQIIMPVDADRKAHLSKVIEALGDAWNVFVEVANEPFKNLPHGDSEARDLALAVQGTTEIPVASGAYSDWPPLETADYGTTHCARTDDWPRKCKDQMDLCNNSGKTPWIGDEPMGASETHQPGKRDTNPDNHAWYASGSQMFSPGATFHCDDGINSVSPIGPTQTECAKAFFWALQWTPRDALIWPYQRGDMGSPEGIGNMPIEHDDAKESRSYCKSSGGQSWCIQIQTSREHATPRDGWRVVSEPRRGFVYLEKP